jgi:hypothetical protein
MASAGGLTTPPHCADLTSEEGGQMRHVLSISLTGVLIGGCAGPDTIRPPTEPSRSASLGTSKVSSAGILDDAIDRLVPALGPPGVALGAPLRQLRDGGRTEAALIDATLRQLAGLESVLPQESAPDADALEVALVALRAAAAR